MNAKAKMEHAPVTWRGHTLTTGACSSRTCYLRKESELGELQIRLKVSKNAKGVSNTYEAAIYLNRAEATAISDDAIKALDLAGSSILALALAVAVQS